MKIKISEIVVDEERGPRDENEITFDYGDINIKSLLVTTERRLADSRIKNGSHLLFCPAMTEKTRATNLYIICTMQDTEALNPPRTQSSEKGAVEQNLQSLETAIRNAQIRK